MPDIELILQVIAYSALGLAILILGFLVIDLLTPGKLGQEIIDGNPNAGLLGFATLLSLGVVLWFAIFFTGAGWGGLVDAAVFGLIAIATQAAAFVAFDLATPGKLGDICLKPTAGAGAGTVNAATKATAGAQFAIALIVAASLT